MMSIANSKQNLVKTETRKVVLEVSGIVGSYKLERISYGLFICNCKRFFCTENITIYYLKDFFWESGMICK